MCASTLCSLQLKCFHSRLPAQQLNRKIVKWTGVLEAFLFFCLCSFFHVLFSPSVLELSLFTLYISGVWKTIAAAPWQSKLCFIMHTHAHIQAALCWDVTLFFSCSEDLLSAHMRLTHQTSESTDGNYVSSVALAKAPASSEKRLKWNGRVITSTVGPVVIYRWGILSPSHIWFNRMVMEVPW